MGERADQVQAAIDRGNVDELLKLAEGGLCACMGARDGEPLCRCLMTSRQVRNAVSYAMLKRGKLVRLRNTAEQLKDEK